MRYLENQNKSMKKFIIIILLFPFILIAQTNQEIAHEKGLEAIKLLDEGQMDASISLLKESEKLDPTNFLYPYEIAYAYNLKQDYKNAIKTLKKLKGYKGIGYEVYQALGHNYAMNGDTERAHRTYTEGLKVFPNAGALHYEIGMIYQNQRDYEEAIVSYTKGIDVEPAYSNNYYQVSKLYLRSNNIVPGLIYGELFMNIDQSSRKMIELSKLLYMSYKNAITIQNDLSIHADFCNLPLDTNKINRNIRVPFCSIFEYHFNRPAHSMDEFNLANLSRIRQDFLNSYFEEHYEKYPNFLFNFLKEIADNNYFEAYNHYVFQMGNEKEFAEWFNENKDTFQRFIEWYSLPENHFKPTRENYYRYTE